MVELYPGLIIEDIKPPRNAGCGICPTYSVGRAVLSDAVTLVRSDRFNTIDYTVSCMTDSFHTRLVRQRHQKQRTHQGFQSYHQPEIILQDGPPWRPSVCFLACFRTRGPGILNSSRRHAEAARNMFGWDKRRTP